MRCRLCGEDKELISAHLIPKWAYRDISGTGGEGTDIVLAAKGKTKRRPVGTYDKNILCGECDNFIGQYDAYGKEVILGKKLENKGQHHYLINGVDLDKFTLFLLSVAWRESISNAEESELVKIGPYEERIRTILLDRQLRKKIALDGYSFIVCKFQRGDLPETVVDKIIQTPHLQRLETINVFVLYLPRAYKIYLKLDRRSFPDELERVSKAYTNSIPVLMLGDYSSSDEFRAMLSAI